MNEASTPIELSVVIVCIQGSISIKQTLESLVNQNTRNHLELLVLFDDRFKELFGLECDFPGVRFIHLSGQNSYAELRSQGVKQSTGRIVAVTESHCVPQSNWAENIIKQHQNPYAAVGGSVEKLTPDTVLDWAIYFADYLRYMNPLREGSVSALTDLNVSYKRTALDKIASVWQTEFHENTVHGELLKGGEILWISPNIVVQQKRNFSFRQAIQDRYTFGNILAKTRIEHATTSQRMKFILFSILIPFVQIARTITQVLSKRRWLGKYLIAFPYLVLLAFVWGFGEFLGYLE